MQAEYSSVGYYYYWSAVAAAAAALFCFFTQKSYILYKSIQKFSREEKKTSQNNLHTIGFVVYVRAPGALLVSEQRGI